MSKGVVRSASSTDKPPPQGVPTTRGKGGWTAVPRKGGCHTLTKAREDQSRELETGRNLWWHLGMEESSGDEDWLTEEPAKVPMESPRPECQLRVVGKKKALKVAVTVQLADATVYHLQALVDTGSEFNLCRKGLFSAEHWTPSTQPVTFLAANQSVVPGGEEEVQTQLHFSGALASGSLTKRVQLPASFYGADIGVDLILSYSWLAQHGVLVSPKDGALFVLGMRGRPCIRGQGREKDVISQQAQDIARQVADSEEGVGEPTSDGEVKEALRIPVMVVLPHGGTLLLKALVDSGAEFNLCNRKLLSGAGWTVSPKPIRLMAANQSVVPGGDETLEVRLHMNGRAQDPTSRMSGFDFSATLYGAEIVEDLILSYSWMSQNNVLIHPKSHALILGDTKPLVWIRAHMMEPDVDSMGSHKENHTTVVPNTKGLRKRAHFQFPPQVWEIPSWRDDPRPYTSDSEDEEDQSTLTQSLDEGLYWSTVDLVPEARVSRGCSYFQSIGLRSLPEVEEEEPWTKEELCELVRRMPQEEDFSFIGKVVTSTMPEESPKVRKLRERLLKDFKSSVFSPEPVRDPPKRGPLGEAEIRLKDGARPYHKPPFHITGERLEAMKEMVQALVDCGKIERANSAWCSPAFPVAKKEPGKYRLVVDYRALNEASVPDSNPLPRIDHILQNQGKFQMWSVLDMKDGYHQVPLKEEHRDYTCMSTPLGNFRWKVLVMGLKNGNAIFQRVMDYVLSEHECANAYIDDVIVGSRGNTEEELVANHDRDLRAVLSTLAKEKMRVNMKKPQLFMRSVQFCGHVLVEGRRYPAPDKLVALQKWELPRTVTALRGFLGLANYYSSYVPHYADMAAPMTSMLQLNRQDGKKGSKKALKWSQEAFDAFQRLKEVLAQKLEVFHLKPDNPFFLRTDASKYAIGAVLEQIQDGERVPVAFFSRKLTGSQRGWSPREQETYAIVAALRKWAGWIGLQPVVVLTDHKALESWVTEHVDTPSGPAGRRGRWHETLSKFDLQVQYVPGKDNLVADALSRWAYPASKALQDCSWHGSAKDWEEMQKIMQEELEDGKMVGLASHLTQGGSFLIFDPALEKPWTPHLCGVTTRGKGKKGFKRGSEEVSTPAAGGWPQQLVDPPPPAAREGDMSSWHVGDSQVECELDVVSNSRKGKEKGEEGRLGDASTNPRSPGPQNPRGKGLGRRVDAPSDPADPQTTDRMSGDRPPLQFHFASERQGWSAQRKEEYERALRGIPSPPQGMEFDQVPPPPQGEEPQQAAADGGRMSSTSRNGARSEEHSVPSHRCTDSRPQPDSQEKEQDQGHPVLPQRPRRVKDRKSSKRGSSNPHSEPPVESDSTPVPEAPLAPELETEEKDGSRDPPRLLDSEHVMDINWMPWYEKCSVGSVLLKGTQCPEAEWPSGLRLEGEEPIQRLYLHDRLLVPQGLTLRVLMTHHVEAGHMGVERMLADLGRRYHLCTVRNLRQLLGDVLRQCQTCQACAPPNWSTHGPIEMNLVPARCMASVALDIFSLPGVEHGGKHHDSLLVCVDRQSGWIVAIPCERAGLTGKKAALLMLEKWEMFGIPDTVVSDKGPQFVSAWWRTMCAGLGIRQAYGISYRSQTNGRAEVAGKTMIGLLRKVHTETGSNWVEALPRALRYHNDAVNDTGMSPYQILFGRERPLGGIPTGATSACEDAAQFMERMKEVDLVAREEMIRIHFEQRDRINRSRKPQEELKVGEWVWMARPRTGVTGHKLNTSWIGPGKVIQRIGKDTYKVQIKPSRIMEVHRDQLKRHIPDVITGKTSKLFHHQLTQPPEEAGMDEWNVEAILAHRRRNGKWEFLTHWEGWGPEEASWEPVNHFFHRYSYPWVAYCKGKGLFREISGILKDKMEGVSG